MTVGSIPSGGQVPVSEIWSSNYFVYQDPSNQQPVYDSTWVLIPNMTIAAHPAGEYIIQASIGFMTDNQNTLCIGAIFVSGVNVSELHHNSQDLNKTLPQGTTTVSQIHSATLGNNEAVQLKISTQTNGFLAKKSSITMFQVG